MTKTIEFDEKCKSCDGTGLYVGMAEGKGFAVVCHDCKGTGKFHFKYEYEEFTERKKSKGIKRVLEYNPGFGAGGVYDENPKFAENDFGGMSYEDWEKGKPFPPKSEMRKFVCPAWWYQCVDCDKKPNWQCCPWGSRLSECEYFKTKEKCWERFDEKLKGSK